MTLTIICGMKKMKDLLFVKKLDLSDFGTGE